MTTLLGRRASGVLAAVFALALAVIMVFSGGLKANAEETNVLDNPDMSQARSLTIHKYAAPTWGEGFNNDGKELTPKAGAKALAKVHFIIAKVNGIDLTKPADWDQVKDLSYQEEKVVGKDSKTYTLGESVEKATGTDGSVTFADLDAGVYLVKEGIDEGGNKITNKAAPFFVTVPLPLKQAEAGKAGWLYDVHVYPKNSVTAVEKKVIDKDAHVGGQAGDKVSWQVDVTVPELVKEGEKHTRLAIHDTFDEKLSYVEGETTVTLDGEKLTKDTDYTITYTKPTVKVELTETGLGKLAGKEGKKVTATFKTLVLKEGVIPNQAKVYVNNPGEENETTTTNKPETPWGKLVIKKFLKDNESHVLKGAAFTIYPSEGDAEKGTNPLTVITSNDNGIAEALLKKGTYYVKETAAPAGYILDKTIHTVNIDPKTEPGGTLVVEMKVPNTKQTVPDLPVTGASGQLLLLVGGSALLLLAIGTGIIALHRRNN